MNFKKTKVVAAVGGASLLATQAAHAALPAGLQAAFDAVLVDAGALSTMVAPIIIGVLALGIVFKLVKRFGNKI